MSVITPSIWLSLRGKSEGRFSAVEIKLLMRLSIRNHTREQLEINTQGTVFTKCFKRLRGEGYIKTVRQGISKLNGRKLHGNVRGVYGISDKGQAWINKYLRDLTYKVEAFEHGY